MRHAIGVDIGGSSTKIGLVSETGMIHARARIAALEGETGAGFTQRLVAAIAALAEPGRASEGIGVGYPGPIHPGNLSGGIGNVPGLINYPLADRLTAALSLPARLENDATAAALAEARFGAGAASARMLMITAGTGIGVAMIVDGAAMVTSGGCLGDAGHMIVDGQSTRRCRLGCTGCLEAFASGEALDDFAIAETLAHPDGDIARHAAAHAVAAGASTVVHCALAGDIVSQAALRDAGQWIGRAAASLAHIFAPDTVVIGGGLAAAGDWLLAPLEAETRRCGLASYTKNLRFVTATMGNDAGIIGAAVQIFAP